MSDLRKDILRTLVYHDVFDYSLTLEQILKFFLPTSKTVALNSKLPSEIKKWLKRLQQEKKVFKKENFYFLSCSTTSKEANLKDKADLRKEREKYAQQKLKVVVKIVRVLRYIPWIKLIALTGGLTMKNSDKDDDIDFLIITSKNRLWLTRLLVIVFLEILGKRTKPGSAKAKDKICPNLFLDELALSMPLRKRNLFIAHEICQMQPVFDRDHTYKKFLQANIWVKKYLPCVLIEMKGNFLYKQKLGHKTARFWLLDFLENLAYKTQLNYKKLKKNFPEISPHYAFFHILNQEKNILNKFRQKCLIYRLYNSS